MTNKQTATAIGSIIIMAALFLVHAFSTFPAIYGIGFTAVFAAYIAALYFFTRKEVGETTLQTITFLQITAVSLLMAFTFFNLMFLLAIVVILSIVFFILKTFYLRDVMKILFMFVVVFIMATTLFQPAVAISTQSGTVLSDNWWNALNWINKNTDQCGVVATYWDPGHFITGIAKRPVVFDGASQNAVWNTTAPAGLSQEQIKAIAATDKFRATNITVNGQPKTLIETARIQDIATTLATSNETAAIKILEKYKIPGCNDMYYLATSDLIGKSYWWTYFSSWNPIDKGCAQPMSQLGLKQAKPSTTGSITYVYYENNQGISAGCNQQVFAQIIINQQNNSLDAFVLQNNQMQEVEQFIYFTDQGGIVRTQPSAPLKGMVFLDPNKQFVIFIPQAITDSMFTKMFFFNGQGLKNFQYVNSWGGEVKLFKISFNQTSS